MTQKERSAEKKRLVELLGNIPAYLYACVDLNAIADELLKNGSIVPPCKAGDTVYVICGGYVAMARVLALYIDQTGGMFDFEVKTNEETTVESKTVICKDLVFEDFGKNVFIDREEAEKALREREKNGT